jgi:hypothetical protein
MFIEYLVLTIITIKFVRLIFNLKSYEKQW